MPRTLVRVCSDFIQPASSVCDLGICLDVECLHEYALFQNRVRLLFRPPPDKEHPPSLTRPVLQSLIMSLVMPWLDYGNAMLAGLPDN